jgi:hypothetical protein
LGERQTGTSRKVHRPKITLDRKTAT